MKGSPTVSPTTPALWHIYEKINTAIKAVGDENGYTYILEDSQVIYKNPTANDVTPLVKAKLNLKDAPATTPATTPAKK